MNLWLLALRRRGDAVACVPTIESSLTPAGAAAVDRARTSLDHLCLPQLLSAHRIML
jgi:flavin-binding protein dodecin